MTGAHLDKHLNHLTTVMPCLPRSPQSWLAFKELRMSRMADSLCTWLPLIMRNHVFVLYICRPLGGRVGWFQEMEGLFSLDGHPGCIPGSRLSPLRRQGDFSETCKNFFLVCVQLAPKALKAQAPRPPTPQWSLSTQQADSSSARSLHSWQGRKLHTFSWVGGLYAAPLHCGVTAAWLVAPIRFVRGPWKQQGAAESRQSSLN